VIDNKRKEQLMDERFANNLLDQIATLTKQLGEAIDENRKLTAQYTKLVNRIIEQEDEKKEVNGN
jgi:regulator of replication initiation timing